MTTEKPDNYDNQSPKYLDNELGVNLHLPDTVTPLNQWSGHFGNEYQDRNASNWQSIKNRSRLFSDIFQIMENTSKAFPASIIEVGGGCGDNLRAIDMIYERTRTNVKLMSCDPNKAARKAMKDIATAIPGDLSQLPYNDNFADMVFTSGVLIHIPPDNIPWALSEIYRVSKRWILSIEYFNPTPDRVTYHGQDNMLWRRDWGKLWLDKYPDLKCLGYGFAWKHTTGLDNLTWFIFEKSQAPM
jgi:pseudaminic acid biosynthesis-associated methylase